MKRHNSRAVVYQLHTFHGFFQHHNIEYITFNPFNFFCKFYRRNLLSV